MTVPLPAPTRRATWRLWLGYLGLSLLTALVCAAVAGIPLLAFNDEQLVFSIILVIGVLGLGLLTAAGVAFLLTIVVSAAGALGARSGRAWELAGVASTSLLVSGLAALALGLGSRDFPPMVLETATPAGIVAAVVLTLFTWRYRRVRAVTPA